MVSREKNLPDSFVPGQKNARTGEIRLSTAKNVKWGRKLCESIYSTPAIVGGKIFIGGRQENRGLMMCLDERTGKLLWQWQAPAKEIPLRIDGWLIGISDNPPALGVCSSPLVDGNRVYFVTSDFKVACLDARGQAAGRAAGKARVVWTYDMWARLKVFPCDAANGSAVVDGDLLYVNTSNGIDRNVELGEGEISQNPFARSAQPDRPGKEHRTAGGHRRRAHHQAPAARPMVVGLAGHGRRSKTDFLRRRRRPLLRLRGAAVGAPETGQAENGLVVRLHPGRVQIHRWRGLGDLLLLGRQAETGRPEHEK